MIKLSGRNAGNHFTGGRRKLTNLVKEMRLFGRKIKMIILRLVILLLVGKIKVVHCNVKSSHLWRKGYCRHTKVQLRYKKNKTTGLDHQYDIEYEYTS